MEIINAVGQALQQAGDMFWEGLAHFQAHPTQVKQAMGTTLETLGEPAQAA